MKLIYLLRHAKSSWEDPLQSDFDRPLTKRGRKAADLMAAHLKDAGITPGVVLCSPARRAVETYERLGLDEAIFDDRLYDASGRTLLARLQDLPAERTSVLLIGHNPGLQTLALSLARAKPGFPAWNRLVAKLPTASLVSLSAEIDDWRDLAMGRSVLDGLVRPRDLEPAASDD